MRNEKSVTMWAIWSPYSKEINTNTMAKKRKESWEFCSDCTAELVIDLKKEGYRAVKGKFVWKEK